MDRKKYHQTIHMSQYAYSISEGVQRLSRRDPILKEIFLCGKQLVDSQLTELIDCLLAHPNVVTRVYLDNNQLTDETGVKLAQYIATSFTVRSLYLYNNQFGAKTYLALAAALRFNSSLRFLYLFHNQVISIENQTHIDAAFIDALILNPNRPTDFAWRLYSPAQNESFRLKEMADQLGHPSLQAMLATQLIRAF